MWDDVNDSDNDDYYIDYNIIDDSDEDQNYSHCDFAVPQFFPKLYIIICKPQQNDRRCLSLLK